MGYLSDFMDQGHRFSCSLHLATEKCTCGYVEAMQELRQLEEQAARFNIPTTRQRGMPVEEKTVAGYAKVGITYSADNQLWFYCGVPYTSAQAADSVRMAMEAPYCSASPGSKAYQEYMASLARQRMDQYIGITPFKFIK